MNQFFNYVQDKGVLLLRPLVTGGGSERMAALDINNFQIKLVVTRRSRGRVVLETIHVGRIEEKRDATTLTEEHADELSWLAKEYNLKGCGVIVSLPYSMYSTRLVVLPRMPRKELDNAIRLDLNNQTKPPAADAVIDYVSVDSFEQEGARYDNHLVAVIDRKALENQVALIQGAGFRLRGFSVASLALRNLINTNPGLPTDSVYAVINLSNEETTFSVIREGKLLFSREIPRTSDELTDALRTIVVPGGETVHLTREREISNLKQII